MGWDKPRRLTGLTLTACPYKPITLPCRLWSRVTFIAQVGSARYTVRQGPQGEITHG